MHCTLRRPTDWAELNRRWLPVVVGMALIVYAWWQTVGYNVPQIDTWTYYVAWRGGLYGGEWHSETSYVYSPAFAQLIAPLTLIPWPVFLGLWMALMAAGLVWLFGWLWTGLLVTFIGPLAALGVMVFGPDVPFANMIGAAGRGYLVTGNITVLMAIAVVLGFRYPAAWALILLTKVTPGIGLLWFAVRREWRNLAIALGATALIAGVSFVFAPHLWFEWVTFLRDTDPEPIAGWVWLDWPLRMRLPLAAAVVAVGALRGWRWSVFVAVFLAQPAIWMTTEMLLLAAIPYAVRFSRSSEPNELSLADHQLYRYNPRLLLRRFIGTSHSPGRTPKLPVSNR